MEKQRSCRERLKEHKTSRLDDLWLMITGTEREWEKEDLPGLFDYGLEFAYVPAGTYRDQEEGYFRYLISWGGPSEEIRYWVDEALNVVRADFWFLDWFDGAGERLKGNELEIAEAVFGQFKDVGAVEEAIKKAEEEEF